MNDVLTFVQEILLLCLFLEVCIPLAIFSLKVVLKSPAFENYLRCYQHNVAAASTGNPFKYLKASQDFHLSPL